MKHFKFGVFAVLSILCFSSCDNNNHPKPEEKQISSCDFLSDSVENYIILNSSLNFNGSSFVVDYFDGSSETFDFEQSMLVEFSSSTLGEHLAKINFDKVQPTTPFFFKYFVFENSNQITFAKEIDEFKYINELTFNDIDSFIDLKESYASLSLADKDFFDDYMPYIPNRIQKSEEYLIDIFMSSKSNELSKFKDSLNTVAYSQGNLDLINSYINSFITSEFVTIESALDAYENTILNIGSVDRKDIGLIDYKVQTIELLKTSFSVDFGRVVFENGSFKYKVENKNYVEADGISGLVSDFEAKVNAASNESSIDEIYTQTYSEILDEFIDVFATDVTSNVRLIFEDVKKIEEELIKTYEDITISVKGLFDNILVDYENDNRWWIPEPYKPYVLLERSGEEILKRDSFKNAVDAYNSLTIEIIKATLQKNIELYYSIWRNENPAYDTSDTLYWNNIAEYNGADGNYFIYDGPLSSYSGNKFSSSFRLAGKLYHSGKLTQQQLLDNYSFIKNRIKPPALAISKISLNLKDVETIIDQYSDFSIEGGIAVVTYNDTRTENIHLDDSMILNPIDTSTPGSKEVVVEFEDPRLHQKHQVSFNIVVKSDVGIFNILVDEINKLDISSHPSEADVLSVKNVVDLFNTLTESQKTTFMNGFTSAYLKLLDAEEKCASLYADMFASPTIRKYEQANALVLTESSKNKLIEGFDNLINTIYSATEFNSIDDACTSFSTLLEGAEIDPSISLANYKELTLANINEICSFEVLKYNGTNYDVYSEKVIRTVANDVRIASLMDEMRLSIESASSIADVNSIYLTHVDAIYDLAVQKIQSESESAAKNSMYELRDTIKGIWSDKGDITVLAGESGSQMTTDYLDDGGYYCWYCPAPYQTGNLYKKLTIEGCTNKYMVLREYQKCLFDMSRVTMHRNILSALLVAGVSANLSKYWPCLYAEGIHEYNGCLEEYVGTSYNYASLRLWCGGWSINPEVCDGTIPQLLGVYNDAIKIFVK